MEPYRPIRHQVLESNGNRLQHATPADAGTTGSPSIDSSTQKDPREFAWHDPKLPEVIHMLQPPSHQLRQMRQPTYNTCALATTKYR